jgi:tetratricopeptide (TPR) repeat protein
VSGYSSKIGRFFLASILATVMCHAELSAMKEDEAIVTAIYLDEIKEYAGSEMLYLQLYEKTKRAEYLLKAAREALWAKEPGESILAKLEAELAKADAPGRDKTAKMLTILYLKKGDKKSALELAERYLSKSSEIENLKLAASIELDAGRYAKAEEILRIAYEKSEDGKILLDRSMILSEYLGKREQAVKLLEEHLERHDDSPVQIYFRLIEYFVNEKRFEDALSIYKKLYEKRRSRFLLEKIVKVYMYMKKYDELIAFLQKEGEGAWGLLYTVYKYRKMLDKAAETAAKAYKDSADPKWLAQEAMALYEDAKKKAEVTPAVLQKFRTLFEKALKEGLKGDIYMNYYGYTLIDEDIDIDRGIELVKKAVADKAQNSYYLDSLAWGYYKKGECKKAYETMELCIDRGGLKEEEIAMHKKMIDKCMEKEKSGKRIDSGRYTR